MYQKSDEQTQRQLDALQSVRDRAMADPIFADKLLNAVGMNNSPRKCTPETTHVKSETTHVKPPTK